MTPSNQSVLDNSELIRANIAEAKRFKKSLPQPRISKAQVYHVVGGGFYIARDKVAGRTFVKPAHDYATRFLGLIKQDRELTDQEFAEILTTKPRYSDLCAAFRLIENPSIGFDLNNVKVIWNHTTGILG
jgi:hypothetical protein